jgi:hypothetical protein
MPLLMIKMPRMFFKPRFWPWRTKPVPFTSGDDLLQKHERWIADLARELGVIPQTIHYWIKQGWIHCRVTLGKTLDGLG